MPPVPAPTKTSPLAIVLFVILAVVLVASLFTRYLPHLGQNTAPAPANTAAKPTTGAYPREREDLTDIERAYYGNLYQGDCVNNPDSHDLGAVQVLDCALPHTDQVAGFVDLSEGMPDRSDSAFEVRVAQRCNSLKATLPIPSDMPAGVGAYYPDTDAWADGVRVALCWAPGYDEPWVGSIIDGTARQR